jgi:arylsulfatase A-like enzyme
VDTNRSLPVMVALAVVLAVSSAAGAQAPQKKPNILIIWGDDIGQSNVSAYSMGLMGYRTPHIDRIAREGMIFTDYYGEQSCTAGRASFLTGQHGLRTGLTKVGLPGATLGLRKEDPTIAELLKPLGYATGQFGKNHLGDRNEFLPTVHGFDEFYGNLYHLNAEEEPELPDYPKDPAFKAKYGPRGVLHCFATDKDDPTDDPRFGRAATGRRARFGTPAVSNMTAQLIRFDTKRTSCDAERTSHEDDYSLGNSAPAPAVCGSATGCLARPAGKHRWRVESRRRSQCGQSVGPDGRIPADPYRLRRRIHQ